MSHNLLNAPAYLLPYFLVYFTPSFYILPRKKNMKLLDNKIHDINNYLTEGKLLPENYRQCLPPLVCVQT